MEADPAKRQALMRTALATVAADLPLLPLHTQNLAWGARRTMELVQPPDNSIPLRYIVMK